MNLILVIPEENECGNGESQRLSEGVTSRLLREWLGEQVPRHRVPSYSDRCFQSVRIQPLSMSHKPSSVFI